MFRARPQLIPPGRADRRAGLWGLAAGLILAGSPFARAETAAGPPLTPPNLLILMTDDQRWDTVGFMGNRMIRTPHLDRLAAEGVVFENHFVTTSICSISRATFYTGQWARRHGIQDFARPLSPEALAKTYFARLRRAGYRVGFVGKWGLGGALPAEAFDYFTGYPGQGRYFEPEDPERVHLTRRLGDQALAFLSATPADQPFCLTVAFKAPHVQDNSPDPFQPDPRYDELYGEVVIPAPKTAAAAYFEALPEFLRVSEGRVRWGQRFSSPEHFQDSVRKYYRLITGVDDVVGELVQALEARGVAGRTVIVFTSDNGFFLAERGLAGKWLMYEESIRTPMMIHDPRLAAEHRGRRLRVMTLNVDLAPTLLDLAGLATPGAMQGRSLAPLMTGEAPADWRTEWFYEHLFARPGAPGIAPIPQTEGVRTERWKYIRYIEQEPPYEELFDLVQDPLEERNLAGEAAYADQLKAMRERWKRLREAAR